MSEAADKQKKVKEEGDKVSIEKNHSETQRLSPTKAEQGVISPEEKLNNLSMAKKVQMEINDIVDKSAHLINEADYAIKHKLQEFDQQHVHKKDANIQALHAQQIQQTIQMQQRYEEQHQKLMDQYKK